MEAAGREHDQAIEEANPPLSIADAWEVYEESSERPDSGEGTLSRYQGYWDMFKEWMEAKDPEAKYLRDIPAILAQGYATHLILLKVNPNTFNKHTGFLKLFFRILEEPARLTGNPFGRIKRKKLKTSSRRELTIAELKTVLDQSEGELKTLLYLGAFTGLRLGDCSTVKFGEVDLDRKIIKRVPNKATNKKPVTIGIPAPLLEQLSSIPRSRRKGYVVPKYAGLYTFQNSDGKYIRQSEITREVQAHFKTCGIQTLKEGTGKYKDEDGNIVDTGKRAIVDVGFHSLRHTYVSLQAERGTPLAVVQAIVGHGSPAMTAHYTHIGEAAALQAAKALDTGITDAEYEVIREVPEWIKEKLKKMTAKNWEKIREELI